MKTKFELLMIEFDHLRGDKFLILFTDKTGIEFKHCYDGVIDAISSLTSDQLDLVVEIHEF